MAGDPDWQFPLDAAEGVPLGVSEPTWRSPGVWPTKDELTGMEFDPEDLETPRGHQNYPSAEEFAESIKETFREEAKLDMVLGPYSQRGGSLHLQMRTRGTLPGANGSH